MKNWEDQPQNWQKHCVTMPEYRFSLTFSFLYKDRIIDSILIWESTGQRKVVFWHILRSEILPHWRILQHSFKISQENFLVEYRNVSCITWSIWQIRVIFMTNYSSDIPARVLNILLKMDDKNGPPTNLRPIVAIARTRLKLIHNSLFTNSKMCLRIFVCFISIFRLSKLCS